MIQGALHIVLQAKRESRFFLIADAPLFELFVICKQVGGIKYYPALAARKALLMNQGYLTS